MEFDELLQAVVNIAQFCDVDTCNLLNNKISKLDKTTWTRVFINKSKKLNNSDFI